MRGLRGPPATDPGKRDFIYYSRYTYQLDLMLRNRNRYLFIFIYFVFYVCLFHCIITRHPKPYLNSKPYCHYYYTYYWYLVLISYHIITYYCS